MRRRGKIGQLRAEVKYTVRYSIIGPWCHMSVTKGQKFGPVMFSLLLVRRPAAQTTQVTVIWMAMALMWFITMYCMH